MKRALLIMSALVLVSAITIWASLGTNRGWTKNRVQVKTVDEVTGLEDSRWVEKFVPGVDFLGGALLGSGILAGASMMFRNKQKQSNNDK